MFKLNDKEISDGEAVAVIKRSFGIFACGEWMRLAHQGKIAVDQGWLTFTEEKSDRAQEPFAKGIEG